jgi:hypothetical protein
LGFERGADAGSLEVREVVGRERGVRFRFPKKKVTVGEDDADTRAWVARERGRVAR